MTEPNTTTAATTFDASTPGRHLGRWVWHELVTSDRDRALAFYTDLIGWSVVEGDLGPHFGRYSFLEIGDHRFGGVVDLDPARDGAGAAPHWRTYAAVDDLDAFVAAVEANGGTVRHPPAPIVGIGRFALVQDPTGAEFAAVQVDRPQPTPVGAPVPGMAWWHELMTSDPERAAAFYGATLGWTAEETSMPTGRYWMLRRGDGSDVGGLMAIPEGSGMAPAWGIYVTVADVAATQARALAAGAHETYGVMEVPGVGRMSGIADPTGAAISLGQSPS